MPRRSLERAMCGKGGVAQLGEHLLCKQGVIGSIPFTSTTSDPRLRMTKQMKVLSAGSPRGSRQMKLVL